MENTITHESSEPDKYGRERMNLWLKDKFGIDTISSLPMWRITWAQDSFEKLFTEFSDFTESGVLIRTVKEVREVPKYPYLQGLYIIELLQIVPKVNQLDLPTQTLSYECMHPLMHKVTQGYLPINHEFIEWVIDCYYAVRGKRSLRRYVDPDDAKEPLQAKKDRVDRIYKYLYGNETATTDALAYKTGVVVPHKQFGDTEQSKDTIQ